MPNMVTDQRPTLAFDTDVLVVGGGAAGLAAAVTAARAGLRVILLQRYGFCGGAAVAGLSGTVCGLYAASEDAHRLKRRKHARNDARDRKVVQRQKGYGFIQ